MALSTLERPITAPAAKEKPPVSPLHNGARLTRAEFKRIYAAHAEITKAERIEGVVYIPSPARHRQHDKSHFDAIFCVGASCVGASVARFPVLWLLPEVLLSREAPRLLEPLQQGVASKERKTFCAELTRRCKEAK